MSKLIVEMEMPKVCMTRDGFYGDCPMDRLWCVERNAPSGTKMIDAYAEMRDNIPSWCPIKGILPEEHGDLIDRDALKEKKIYSYERHEYVVPVAYIDWQNAVIAAERKDNEQCDMH